MPKSQYNRTRFFLHKLKNFAGSLKQTNEQTPVLEMCQHIQSYLDLVCFAATTAKRHEKNLVSDTHYTRPQNPFKIELNKNKDKIILLNPLEIVMGLILDCDSQPRISLTTQIIMILNALPLSGDVVFRAEMVDPDRAAFTQS